MMISIADVDSIGLSDLLQRRIRGPGFKPQYGQKIKENKK
jgi:hypothetical protein